MHYRCDFVTSTDANSIQQSIERRRIRMVWHLTRVTQLRDIFRIGALLSRSEMDRLGIPYGMSGWGSSEKAEELKRFICCSIIYPWGMSSQEPETKALICLKPIVLLRKGVSFCGAWSSFNDVAVSNVFDNCTAEAFDLMFENVTSDFPAPPPGEFLVPDCIPISEFLPRVYFYDEDTKQRAIQSCSDVNISSGASVTNVFQFIVDTYPFRGRA